MFIDTKNLRVYIYTEIIDMRCGFERLLYFVRIQMKNDINQGHLYLFFGKNRRRLKHFSMMVQVLCKYQNVSSAVDL